MGNESVYVEDLAEFGLISYAPDSVPATNYECGNKECNSQMWDREYEQVMVGWCESPMRSNVPYAVFRCPDCGELYMHHIVHHRGSARETIAAFVAKATRQMRRQEAAR